MKTNLLLFAALLISTITFSQTTKKGYDHYKALNSSAQKMNKGELIDAIAKDAGNSKSSRNKKTPKRPGRVKYSNITLEKRYLDDDSDNDGLQDGVENCNDFDNDCDDATSTTKRMNKGELIDAMAKGMRVSKSDSRKTLNPPSSFKKGNSVQLIGSGTSFTNRSATKESEKVAKFKAGKALADTVKNH